MAVKTKAQLASDISGLPTPITRAALTVLLDDMVDSYEDIIQEYTTAARNGLTPVTGQKIFNTDNKRLEIYSGTAWLPCSQKDAVALDASSNPNYPQGGVGDLYIITNSGRVGGSGGKPVYVGQLVYCVAENAGGNEAAVGVYWRVSGDASETALTPTPTWYKVFNASYAGLSAAATTFETDIYTLPAKAIIHDCKVIPTVAFSGGGISAYTLSVGISGNATKYCAAKNLFTGFAINATQTPIQGIESMSGTTAIKCTATSTTANLDQATAGDVDIYLLLSILEDN